MAGNRFLRRDCPEVCRRRMYPRDLRNPRFRFATSGTAFGRSLVGMVRGRRPRLQTNRVYPCRFVSVRGSPVAQPFGSHLERRFGRCRDALENLRFKFAAFGKAFGRHTSGIIRGGRPRLHQAPLIRVDPRPSVVAPSRSYSEATLDDASVTAEPRKRARGRGPFCAKFHDSMMIHRSPSRSPQPSGSNPPSPTAVTRSGG